MFRFHLFRTLYWLIWVGLKWRLLVIALLVILIIALVGPLAEYYSRARKPANYSATSANATAMYVVSYNSGDGVTDNSIYTLKVIETGVQIYSEPSFHIVTVYNSYPKRKVNAMIVGSTEVTLAGEEIWRSQSDLRIVHRKVMQKDLPIVNTAITQIAYSGYENYPGWPYHLGDSWTYEESYKTDVPLQPSWTDTFRANVVADDAIVELGGEQYHCFKVVHTLIATTNKTPPGGGVGSTLIEYWYKDAKSIGPVKVEDSLDFRGTETQTLIGKPSPLPF